MEQKRDYMKEIREIIMFNHKDFDPLFYDIVYNNFIDRVKDKRELTTDEYHKIIEEMAKTLFPYLPVSMIEHIIEEHGWKYSCPSVGENLRSLYKKISLESSCIHHEVIN